jgi:hypothetical protein
LHFSLFCLFSGGVLVVEEVGSTWREPPTLGKQLVNFITFGCESSAPFFVIYKAGREPTLYKVVPFAKKKNLFLTSTIIYDF